MRPSRCRGLGSCQRRPKIGLSGHIGEPPVGLNCLRLAVQPEDLGPPGRRPGQSEQEADGCRLAGPIGTQIAEDFSTIDLEIEVHEGIGGAVTLG
jgi:hypothetical protein